MNHSLRDVQLGLRQATVDLVAGRRLVNATLLLGLCALDALLEHRVDSTMAVNRSLAATMGLVLPLLVFITVPRAERGTALSLLARHGAHRRWLMVGELTVSLFAASLLSTLAIVGVRCIARVPTDRFLASDASTCVGIGMLGVLGYWGVLCVVGRWGRGLVASVVALIADFWLGHSEGLLSLVTVHGHVRNLLFGIEGTHLAATTSSYLLLSVGLAGSAYIVLRTRP
jgi:hypothetical protein